LLYVILFFVVLFFIFRRTFFPLPPNINPEGKAVFVTGAASGIGKATVDLLVSQGVFVFAADVNEDLLQKSFEGNDNVRIIKLDVTSQSDMDSAVEVVKNEGRGLYGVVNSAGTAGKFANKLKCGAEYHVEKEARFTLEINLMGTMRVNHGLLDFILESKGCIINIASVFGRVAPVGAAIYAASKHGINGYTAAIRRELFQTGVRVFSIEPGGVATPLLQGSPLGTEPDLTETKVITQEMKKRLDRIKGPAFASIQPPERVAGEIVRCLFSSGMDEPHVVVDYPMMKVVWLLASTIPHAWLDWIMEKS